VAVFLANLLAVGFLALWLLVIGRVLLSWFDPSGRSQASAFVIAATEPLLAPVRRLLPPTGTLDLSPMIVLIVLSVLWGLLRPG
jgi:YggT family protein